MADEAATAAEVVVGAEVVVAAEVGLAFIAFVVQVPAADVVVAVVALANAVENIVVVAFVE